MSKLPQISGSELVHVLQKRGFTLRRQHGSHIIMRRDDPFAQTVVPNHRRLDRGTLRAILNQASITVDELNKLLWLRLLRATLDPSSPVKPARGRPSEWKELVAAIAGGDDFAAVEAAKRLSDLSAAASLKPLLHLIHTSPSLVARDMAAYALMWMKKRRLRQPFIDCLADASLPPSVRGYVAEGLGLLDYEDKRRRAYKSAESALVAGLVDPSPIVRFWCCFALGSLGSRRAITPLEKLRDNDKEICPGCWPVAEEASDALDMIAGRFSPRRIPSHLRPPPDPKPR